RLAALGIAPCHRNPEIFDCDENRPVRDQPAGRALSSLRRRWRNFDLTSRSADTWHLELPTKVRQIDYDMISDVILQVRDTARDGGARLRQAAIDYVEEHIGEIAR